MSIRWLLVVSFCGWPCSWPYRRLLVRSIEISNGERRATKALRLGPRMGLRFLYTFRVPLNWVLGILGWAHVNGVGEGIVVGFWLTNCHCRWSCLRFQSRVFLFRVRLKILKILFGGLGEGKNGCVWLELTLWLSKRLVVHAHTLALLMKSRRLQLCRFLARTWWRSSFWNITVCLQERMLGDDLDSFICLMLCLVGLGNARHNSELVQWVLAVSQVIRVCMMT